MFLRKSWQRKQVPNGASSISVPTLGHASISRFFLDTFTDANTTLLQSHTSDSGHTWSKTLGSANFTINTNRVYSASSATVTIYKSSVVPPNNDYYIECTYDLLSDLINDRTGIMVRIPDNTDSGYVFEHTRSTDTWRLIRITAGTNVVIGDVDYSDNWTTGSRVAKLEVIGSTINCYVGGVLRVTATDSNFPSGGFGFRNAIAQTTSTGRHATQLQAFG